MKHIRLCMTVSDQEVDTVVGTWYRGRRLVLGYLSTTDIINSGMELSLTEEMSLI